MPRSRSSKWKRQQVKEGKRRPPNKPKWEMYPDAEIVRRIEAAKEWNRNRPKGARQIRFIKLRHVKEANGVTNKRIKV